MPVEINISKCWRTDDGEFLGYFATIKGPTIDYPDNTILLCTAIDGTDAWSMDEKHCYATPEAAMRVWELASPVELTSRKCRVMHWDIAEKTVDEINRLQYYRRLDNPFEDDVS